MDLAQLKFVVDTSELKNATTEIEKLGSAVSKINRPVQELVKTSEKLNQEQSKTEKTSVKVTEATKKQTSVLERQQMVLEFMTQGYSKGQSSQLAYAKAAGALTNEIEQLGKVLQTQRTLMGTDPFDKSMGALQSLRNEYTVIKEVQRLYNAELGLTKTQMEDLAREKLRLIEKYKLEGKSLSEIKTGLIELNTAYIKNATAENSVVTNMRNRQKAMTEISKANDYIIAELDRVNRLTSENGNITSATNNKLIAFEKALRSSGMSASEQVKKLDAYRTSLESIQKASGQRQVDYLSRALGPQITDVFVGLATGQSPMMVLLQQGGQLRDQFALAGVAGKDMGDMLVQASKTMVTSIKDVALAVGGLLVNAVKSTGSTIVTTLLAPLKLAAATMYDMATGANTTASAIEGLKVAFLALGRAGILVLITAAVTAVVALKDLFKEQMEVSKAANLMGGALGLTTNSIYEQAKAFAGTEGSMSKYIAAINSAAKAGVNSSNELKYVTDAMLALQKVGIDSDETAKRFANLGKEPTKELRAFAKESGLIKPIILEQVRLLEEQGKKSEAVALATKEMSKAMVGASEKIQGEQGYIVRAFNAIASGAKSMWDAILNIGRPTSLSDQLGSAIKKMQELQSAGGSNTARKDKMVSYQADVIKGILEQIGAEQQLKKEKEESSKAGAAGEEADKARKKAQDELNKALEYTNGLLSKSDGFTADYAEKVQMLNAAFKTGKYSLDKQNEAWAELLKSQPIVKKAIQDAADAEKERAKALELIDKLSDKSIGFTKEYSSSLKTLDNALLEGWISQEQFNDSLANLDQGQPIIQRLSRAYNDLKTALGSNTIAMEGQIDSIQIERQLIGSSNEEREYRLGLIKAEITYQKELQAIMAKIRTGDLVDPGRITELLQKASENRNLGINLVNEEASLRSAKKVFEQYTEFASGVSNAIETALFEGGEAGKKKLRDVIVAELRKPITLVINAVVNATLGNMLQGITGGAAGSFAGSASGGLLSNFAIGGATLGAQATAFGQGIASGFSTGAPVSSLGSATSGSFNAGASYGAPVIGAIGGMAINRGISGGYQINKTVNTLQDVATLTAAFVPVIGPLLALGTGAISGLANRAFGRKLTDVGIQGTVGGQAGFAGQQYTFEKGGWFRSDKTTTSQLDEATRSGLASAFRVIKSGILDLTDSIGIGSDAIDNFSTSFKVNLKGLSEEDATKAINTEFARIQEQMAKAALGTDKYTRQNESSYETLVRLSNFMQTINGSFKNLGFETYKLELASIDAAQAFVDLFGGIEGFTQAFSFFYENFFSDTEKTANLTRELTTEFNKLGKSLPATRDEFKQMVITAKAAGDDQLVKSLLDLQYAFADLVPVTASVTEVTKSAAEEAKAAAGSRKQLLESLQSSTDIAYAALERTIASDKKAIDKSIASKQSEIDERDKQRSITESTINSLTSLFDLLKSNIKELYNEVDSVSSMTFKSARQFISNAATSGVLPDENQLSDAIGSVRTGLDKNYYKTKADAERDRIILANELVEIQNLTEKQLTDEQKMLKSLDSQIDLLKQQIDVLTLQKTDLDNILVSAKEQVDAIRGVDTSIKDLNTAISDLATAIAAQSSAMASSEQWISSNGSTTWSSTGGAVAVSTSGGGYTISGKNGESFTGTEVVDWVTGQLGKGDALSVYQKAIDTGVSANSLDAIMGWTPGTSNAWAEENSLPKFANGGSYQGGLALVGETGPELINFNQSGQVYNAGQTAGLLGGSSDLVDELQALRQEVVMLRAEVRADVQHNAKTAKLLDRVIPDGQSVQVKTVV